MTEGSNDQLRAVIFDLDDTLLKTSVVKWAHHKAVAKAFYDIDLTDEVLRAHWGMPFEPMMAIFYQNSDTPQNMLAANLSLEEKFPKELQDDSLTTVNTLLEAKVEVGVITSILGHLATKDLLRLEFPVDEFFLIQGADDTPMHKPDPAVFDRAIELLAQNDISKQQIVYVGDALIDYYAARDAGIKFTGVATGFVSQEQFEAEGAVAIPSLRGLLRVIDL